jgi:hypothetical protein
MSERIRVEVVRSGGFAGITRTGSVDTADLDEQQTATLLKLLEESRLGTESSPPVSEPRRGADRFQYEVTILRDGERRSFLLGESDLSAAQQSLIRSVLGQGKTPPGG